MEKIASFTVNHLDLIPGVYVSRKDYVGQEVLTTFDLRMCAPNREPVMNTAELHTIEHLAATYLRNEPDWKEKIIYFGPMGCRTGCYLILAGDYASKDVVELVRDLKCEGLTKKYGSGAGEVTALDGISLSVQQGEFVAVMGASGSGKSTLLHILGTVDQPTAGRVMVEGVDISALNPREAAIFRRRKVGIVYQFYNLIPTLTIRKNILMPLLLDRRRPNADYFDRVTQTLGIRDKLESLPGQLSGGQQQRAAIARALIYRPAILLADEPTGNLDRKNSEEVVDLLRLSNRNLKQTILLITHDEKIALKADRIVTLEDGRIAGDRRQGQGGEQ